MWEGIGRVRRGSLLYPPLLTESQAVVPCQGGGADVLTAPLFEAFFLMDLAAQFPAPRRLGMPASLLVRDQ